MKFTSKMLATSMIAAASAVPDLRWGSARLPQPTAAAAPAPAPSLPGLPFLQQLATNPAAATQLVQGLTSVLGGAQAAAPAAAAPATPAPAATASVTLPQPAAPAAAPAAAAAPATAPQNLIPSGEMNVPNVPFLPVPLPQQLSFPGDLAALMPSGLMPGAVKPAAAPAAPAAAAPRGAAAAPAARRSRGAGGGTRRGLAPLVMPLSALP